MVQDIHPVADTVETFDVPDEQMESAHAGKFDFPARELATALWEQTFAITDFQLSESPTTSSALYQASARVILLEGTSIVITLTSRGYVYHTKEGEERVYEALEDLLSSVSPQYTQAKQLMLLTKLELLSQKQDDKASISAIDW